MVSEWQIEKDNERETDTHEKQRDRETKGQSDRVTKWQRDRLTEKQWDREAERQKCRERRERDIDEVSENSWGVKKKKWTAIYLTEGLNIAKMRKWVDFLYTIWPNVGNNWKK